MTLPKSLAAYKECEEHFNQAMESPRGIVLTMPDKSAAVRYRLKLNSYRSLLRKRNKEIYPVDAALHNATEFDYLVVRLDKNDECKLRIEPAISVPVTVEQL